MLKKDCLQPPVARSRWLSQESISKLFSTQRRRIYALEQRTAEAQMNNEAGVKQKLAKARWSIGEDLEAEKETPPSGEADVIEMRLGCSFFFNCDWSGGQEVKWSSNVFVGDFGNKDDYEGCGYAFAIVAPRIISLQRKKKGGALY